MVARKKSISLPNGSFSRSASLPESGKLSGSFTNKKTERQNRRDATHLKL